MSNPFAVQDRPGFAKVALLALAPVTIAVATIGVPVFRQYGFPLDDSWIHQVVARNLAEFGIPSFVAGQAASGSTSPIWPYLLAVKYCCLSQLGFVEYTFAINSLLLLALTLGLFFISIDDQLSFPEAGSVWILPALTGNFAWLLSSGMEHLLLCAAIVVATYTWFQQSQRCAAISGALVGLSFLTRPEAIAFVPVFFVAGVLLKKDRESLAIFGGICLLASLLLIVNNYWTSGSVAPVTFGGRRWLYGLANGTSYKSIYDFLFQLTMRLEFFKPDFVQYRWFLIPIPFGLWLIWKKRAYRLAFLIILAAVNIVCYLVLLPNTGQAGRYQALALMLTYPLFGLGLVCLADLLARMLHLSSVAAKSAKILALGGAISFALLSLLRWSHLTKVGIEHVNNTHVEMGKWISKNIPPNELVASFDIGAIGYYGGNRIVDLGGLVDPSYLAYLYNAKVAKYLEQKKVRYIVLPINPGPIEEGIVKGLGLQRIQKQELVRFASRSDLWEEGFAATRHAFETQALFQIRELEEEGG